jgi:hypothetical protein
LNERTPGEAGARMKAAIHGGGKGLHRQPIAKLFVGRQLTLSHKAEAKNVERLVGSLTRHLSS